MTLNINNELKEALTMYAKSRGFAMLSHLMIVALNEYIRRHPPKERCAVMQDWLEGKL